MPKARSSTSRRRLGLEETGNLPYLIWQNFKVLTWSFHRQVRHPLRPRLMMPEGQGEQCGGPSTSCRRLRQRNLLQSNCWRKFADYIDFTLAFPRVTMWTNRIEPTLVKHSIRILEWERFAHGAHIVLCNLLTWLLHPLRYRCLLFMWHWNMS